MSTPPHSRNSTSNRLSTMERRTTAWPKGKEKFLNRTALKDKMCFRTTVTVNGIQRPPASGTSNRQRSILTILKALQLVLKPGTSSCPAKEHTSLLTPMEVIR